MKKTIRTKDSSRCSDTLFVVLASVLLTLIPLRAVAQRDIFELPEYRDKTRTVSLTLGGIFARDTYLSMNRYSGTSYGFEVDEWVGHKPDRFFRYGRLHTALWGSPMKNRVGSGSTIDVSVTVNWSDLWPAIHDKGFDMLVGPSVLTDFYVLYNRMNSNNPVNVANYISVGVTLDNTYCFTLRNQPLALQSTLNVPLLGLSVAPDYDGPYWVFYKHKEYGKLMHLSWPFSNKALSLQLSALFPMFGQRIKVGYTFDYMRNNLGGNYRYAGTNMLSVGVMMDFSTKEWRK